MHWYKQTVTSVDSRDNRGYRARAGERPSIIKERTMLDRQGYIEMYEGLKRKRERLIHKLAKYELQQAPIGIIKESNMDKALKLYFMCILDPSLTEDDFAELCVYDSVSDEDYLNAHTEAKKLSLTQIETIAEQLGRICEFNAIKMRTK